MSQVVLRKKRMLLAGRAGAIMPTREGNFQVGKEALAVPKSKVGSGGSLSHEELLEVQTFSNLVEVLEFGKNVTSGDQLAGRFLLSATSKPPAGSGRHLDVTYLATEAHVAIAVVDHVDEDHMIARVIGHMPEGCDSDQENGTEGSGVIPDDQLGHFRADVRFRLPLDGRFMALKREAADDYTRDLPWVLEQASKRARRGNGQAGEEQGDANFEDDDSVNDDGSDSGGEDPDGQQKGGRKLSGREKGGGLDAKDPPNVRRDLDGRRYFCTDRSGYYDKMRELIGVMRTTQSVFVQQIMAPNMVLDKGRYWDMVEDAAKSPARRQDFPGIRQVWDLRICQDSEVFWRYFSFKWSANKPGLMSLIHFDGDPAGRVAKLTSQSANLPVTTIEGRYWLADALERFDWMNTTFRDKKWFSGVTEQLRVDLRSDGDQAPFYGKGDLCLFYTLGRAIADWCEEVSQFATSRQFPNQATMWGADSAVLLKRHLVLVYARSEQSVYPHSLEVAECLEGLAWESSPLASSARGTPVDQCAYNLGGLLGVQNKNKTPMCCSSAGLCPRLHASVLGMVTWREALAALDNKACTFGQNIRDEYKRAVDAHQKKKAFL